MGTDQIVFSILTFFKIPIFWLEYKFLWKINSDFVPNIIRFQEIRT